MTLDETLISGRVHAPGEDGYEAQRLPWQRKFDPFPSLIVEAGAPADVVTALRIARQNDLPIAVQSTGHGVVSSSDGTLLLKTAELNGVEVDPERRVARAGAGTPWGDVIAAAAAHGLAPLSGTSPGVGVAGYTLGGGAGLLSRTYGFAADSLLRAEVVTAGGELITASADEHGDLFWALRGGGGNFGIVTELEFRLYPADPLYGGMAFFDAARAPAALARYRDWALDEPDESNTALVVMTLPPLPQVPEALRGRRVLMLRSLYAGDAAEGERVIAPLLEAAGEPLMGGFAPLTYGDTATMMGPPPPPAVGEVHIEFFRDVPDDVLDVVADPDGPPVAIEFRHWGGEMARPGDDAGPIGHRDVPFSVVVTSLAQDRAGWPAAKADADEIVARLRPYATGASFLNFLGDPARTRDAYTPADYERLREVKATYDPDNVFHRGHNIPPSS
jgi:FAD/FMN-containing dehydrogenase